MSRKSRRTPRKTNQSSMRSIKKLILLAIVFFIAASAWFFYWAGQPITTGGEPIEFAITPGSGVGAASQQIAKAGVPIYRFMFSMLARKLPRSSRSCEAATI